MLMLYVSREAMCHLHDHGYLRKKLRLVPFLVVVCVFAGFCDKSRGALLCVYGQCKFSLDFHSWYYIVTSYLSVFFPISRQTNHRNRTRSTLILSKGKRWQS